MAHTVSHSTVFHVGDLSVDRERPHFSYEGRGLSVSRHPDAWRQIARGVDGETYELTKSDAVFYEAGLDGPRDAAVEWCVEHGLVERVEGYEGRTPDPETGDDRVYVFYDEERATIESQADVIPEASVTPVEVLKLSEKGQDYWLDAFQKPVTEAEPLEVEALLPVLYARHALDVDGVWWDERLDVGNYSAPRGTIFQPSLSSWDVRVADER